MNFKTAWTLMYRYKGSNYSLDRIQRVLGHLNNPQDSYKTIHIAGTNGKGSLNSYMTHVLIYHGYNVGSYTSPAVFHPLEIIQVNQKRINQKDFSRLFNIIYNICLKEDVYLTSFEYMTVIAYLYFRERKVDYAVIECGCGGDNDATNMEKDNIAIFGDISLDHVALLGPTIKDIIHHKAGIMRRKSIAFHFNEPSVNGDLKQEASQRGCQLITVTEPLEIQLSMLGSHQKENAAVIYAVAMYLGLDSTNTIQALKDTYLLGRISVYKDHTILDGSHNPKAGMALVQTLKEFQKEKNCTFILVLGMFKDKDYLEYIQILKDINPKKVYVFKTISERALAAEELYAAFDKQAVISPSIEAAVKESLAYQKTVENTYIVYSGSFSALNIIKGVIDHESYQ